MDPKVRRALEVGRENVEFGWVSKAMAKGPFGEVVGARNPAAVCWCALGAIFAAVPEGPEYTEVVSATVKALVAAIPTSHGNVAERTITSYNDAPGRTKAEMLDLFDRALAKTEATPA